ncbi:MAG: hypothetical protein HN380_23750, partial [Victivallales bacterium]|nr:hypothetical protein [Victivallales bacterium]
MATRLLVKAGEHTRQQCPVSAEIETAGLNPECLVLTTEEGLPIPCQVEQVGDKLHLSWVLDELAAKQEAVFLVGQGDAPDQAGVELSEKQTGQIDVSLSGKLFTSFCYGPPWSRPFLHPVIGPYGEPITRAYPVVKDVPGESQDHPHHKSFWVAWGDVNDADNWSESEKGHAHQVVRELKEAVSGPAFGRISCGLDWVSEAGEKQLEEDRELVFHNLSKSCRAVDLKVVFRATEGKIRFGDTKEGGICSIRVATSMDAGDQGTIVNSYGGTNEAETWG